MITIAFLLKAKQILVFLSNYVLVSQLTFTIFCNLIDQCNNALNIKVLNQHTKSALLMYSAVDIQSYRPFKFASQCKLKAAFANNEETWQHDGEGRLPQG